jgi:hydrogenase expression/formation protein HypC
MCLGVPGRLLHADGVRGRVDLGGVERDVDLSILADEQPRTGDWVLVHLGFAMSRLTPAEATDQLDALLGMRVDGGLEPPDEILAAWGLADQGTRR